MAHPGGRPTTYNEKIANEICHVVSNTPLMLEEICNQNAHFPTAKTVYHWRLKFPEFGKKYAIAKQEQIEPLVSTILEKARDSKHDLIFSGEKMIVNTAAIKRLQIEVDAIKWFASKLAPKLYGNKNIEEKQDKTLDELKEIRETMQKCMKSVP